MKLRWSLCGVALASGCALDPAGHGFGSTGSSGDGTAESTGAPTTSGDGSSDAATDPGGSTGASSSDSGEPPKYDVASVPDARSDCAPGCEADAFGQTEGLWLLHVTQDDELVQVDVTDGSTTLLCNIVLQGGGGLDGIATVTFTRDNRLMASSGEVLFEIDPCACTAVSMGAFPTGWESVFGIAPAPREGLRGISADADRFLSIDADDAELTEIGPLGWDFSTHGLTWSAADQTYYAIRGNEGAALFEIDPDSGAATFIAALSVPFTNVGMELHPATDVLYGCTGDGVLYEIDRATGEATALGSMDVPICTNLGAPWADGGTVCLPAG